LLGEFFSGKIQNIILLASKNANVPYGREDIKEKQYEEQKLILSKKNLDILTTYL